MRTRALIEPWNPGIGYHPWPMRGYAQLLHTVKRETRRVKGWEVIQSPYLANPGFKFKIERREQILASIIHPRSCRKATFDLGLQYIDDLMVLWNWPPLIIWEDGYIKRWSAVGWPLESEIKELRTNYIENIGKSRAFIAGKPTRAVIMINYRCWVKLDLNMVAVHLDLPHR